jgi:hypothetical protein
MAFKKIIYASVNQPDTLAALKKAAAQERIPVTQLADFDVEEFLDRAALSCTPGN